MIRRELTEIIARAAAQGVYLKAAGGNLGLIGPGQLSPPMHEALKQNKPAILDLLHETGHFPCFPLRRGQRALWQLCSVPGVSSLYNVFVAFSLRPSSDLGRLGRAVKLALRKHPFLASSFVTIDGDVLHRLANAGEIDQASVMEVCALGATAPELRIRELAAREFDMRQAPLVRFLLLSRGDQSGYFAIVSHHLIVDFGALQSITAAVMAAYREDREAADAPPLARSYAEYVLDLERKWTSSPGAGTFWGPRILRMHRHFPALSAGRVDAGLRREELEVTLDLDRQGVRRFLKSLSQHGVTEYAFFLSAFQRALVTVLGVRECLVGTPVDRRSADWSGVVGNFVDFVPLELRTDSGEPFAATVERAHAELCQVLSTADSFQRELALQSDVPAAFRCQVALIWVPEFLDATLDEPFDAVLPCSGQLGALEQLTVILTPTRGGVRLRFIADQVAFDRALCLRLAAEMEREAQSSTSAAFAAVLASPLALPGAGRAAGKSIVGIAATCAMEPMGPRFAELNALFNRDIGLDIAPLNTVIQALISGSGPLSENRAVCAVMWRVEDWLSANTTSLDFERAVEQLRAALNQWRGASSSYLLFGLLPSAGRRSLELQASIERLVQFVQELPRSELLDFSGLDAEAAASEPFLERIAGVPYGPEAYASIASTLYRRASLHFRAPFKAIIVDCDNTLWAGVCGEGGPSCVALSPALEGFQRKLVELATSGFIVCLVSRNDEEDVLNVFRERPEMPLRLEHVSTYRINWGAKSANIESIAQELNIGTDAIVFIDDDPVNLLEVRHRLPEVLALQMPQRDPEIFAFLRNTWAFDRARTGSSPVDRTRFYQANRQRRNIELVSVNLEQYICSLGIEIDVRALRDDWERVAELFQRTNQFVFNGKRLDVPALKAFAEDPARRVYVVSVKDRFGDYGVVGAFCLVFSPRDLSIHSLALSCRALGRGVEHHVLRCIGGMAIEAGCREIVVAYEPTSKNEPARQFLCMLANVDDPDREIRVSPELASALSVVASASGTATRAPEAEGTGTDGARPPSTLELEELRALEQISERGELGVPAVTLESSGLPLAAIDEASVTRIVASHFRSAVDWSNGFFGNGGTSLQGLATLAQLNRELGVEASFQDLYGATSLLEFVARLGGPASTTGLARIPVLERHGAFAAPIGPAQRRVLFLQLMNPGSTLFNNPAVLEFAERFELRQFERAVGALVARWEPLRTRFERVEGGFIQRITSSHAGGPIVRVRDVPEDWVLERERHVRPFDVLGEEALVRLDVMRRPSGAATVFVDVHHAIADGRSFGILLDDLAAAYCDSCSLGASTPSIVPIQFADYAAWQDALGFPSESVTFWKQSLAVLPPRLVLPWTEGTPDQPVFRTATHVSRLGPELMAAASGLAQREGVSLVSVMLSCFAILLERLSSQCEVIVGVPVSGRAHPAIEGIVGMFVNTLPLRLEVARRSECRDLLRDVAARLQTALVHQAYPLDKIVQDCKVEREANKNPLMDVLFSFGELGSSHPRSGAGGVALRRLPANEDIYYLSFDLYSNPAGGGVELQIVYASEVFSSESIRTWAAIYEQILRAVVGDPSTVVEAVEVVTAADRARLLGAGSAYVGPDPFEGLVHRVERYSLEHPSAEAISQGGRAWSYAQLVADSARYAAALENRGVQKGDRVILSVDKGYPLLVALFAVLRRGAVYINVERGAPEGRLHHILEETRPKLIVASEQPAAAPPGTAVATIDAIAAEAATLSPTEAALVRPEDAMYIVYTSGTTGRPKGVVITHGNSMAMATGESNDYGIDGASPRVLQLANVAFDVFTGDLLRCFLNGGCLTFPEVRELVDPEEVRSLIDEARITTLETTPALAVRFFSGQTAWRPRWSALELLIVGSDVFTWSDYAAIRQGLPEQTRIVNSYGVSEATIDSTWSCADSLFNASRQGVIPIGRALTHVTTYVVNSGLKLQPFGVPGELLIAGPTVSPGYIGGGDAKRFQPSPFRAGERLYCTGDRVRLGADGTLTFEGRLDRQVKLRGIRIEPSEVENQLLRLPEVRRARVSVARVHGQDRLVAWYEAEAELPRATIMACLRRELPAYMLPEELVWLRRFPVNDNGKVDAVALLEQLPAAPPALPPTRDDAEDPTLMGVRRVWAKVLQHENFGLDESFFSAGGDSIGLLDVQAGLRSELGEVMAITDLFRWSSVRGTAQFLRDRKQPSGPAHPKQQSPKSIKKLVEALGRGTIGVADAHRILRELEAKHW
jgi:amino acid adenylation domain-containing protein/FkbH-like protein